ncbi:MAG: hypothetical protein FWC81_01705 [Coriobacteriia bacterium]|nr:hypothetical protein [Coriobacteriia bacterium]
MQCTQCRSDIVPGGKFCTSCGAPVESAEQALTVEQSTPDVGATTTINSNEQAPSAEPQSLEDRVNAKLAALDQTSAPAPIPVPVPLQETPVQPAPLDAGMDAVQAVPADSIQAVPTDMSAVGSTSTAADFSHQAIPATAAAPQQDVTSAPNVFSQGTTSVPATSGAFPQVASSPSLFPDLAHQPKKKKIPTWGIVAIVAGVLTFLLLCCVAPVAMCGNDFLEIFNADFNVTTLEEERFTEQAPDVAQDSDSPGIPSDSSEIDPAILEAIVGEYEAIAMYTGFDGTFSRHDFNGDGEFFVFNSNRTFTHYLDVSHRTNSVFLEGYFSAEVITVDDIWEFDRLSMNMVEERIDAEWYRITLHMDNQTFGPEMDIYLSWQGDNDVIVYSPTFGETLIVDLTR